jgi:hypothetical protein
MDSKYYGKVLTGVHLVKDVAGFVEYGIEP